MFMVYVATVAFYVIGYFSTPSFINENIIRQRVQVLDS